MRSTWKDRLHSPLFWGITALTWGFGIGIGFSYTATALLLHSLGFGRTGVTLGVLPVALASVLLAFALVMVAKEWALVDRPAKFFALVVVTAIATALALPLVGMVALGSVATRNSTTRPLMESVKSLLKSGQGPFGSGGLHPTN